MAEALRAIGLGDARPRPLREDRRGPRRRFDGAVPDGPLELRSLPGVGDYVAQAVLCFGFGRRAVLVDTNTARIVRAASAARDDARRWQLRLDLHRLAGGAGPGRRRSTARCSTSARSSAAPATPRCDECPLAGRCAGTGAGARAGARSSSLAEDVAA